MNYATSIIATPLQPGQLRACPHCGDELSQTFVRTERHEKVGEIRVYRCRKCEKEVEYVVRLPLHVV